MYHNLGYIVYRTVIDYYAGPGDVDEDAYGEWFLHFKPLRARETTKVDWKFDRFDINLNLKLVVVYSRYAESNA